MTTPQNASWREWPATQRTHYVRIGALLVVLLMVSAVSAKVDAMSRLPISVMSVSAHRANDSLKNSPLKQTEVRTKTNDVLLTIRSADIARFPEVRVIVDVQSLTGKPLDTLRADDLTVMENDIEKKILSVERLQGGEKVGADFVFALDITGSMQALIEAVRNNVVRFTDNLVKRGIEYRLGLVLFDDAVVKTYSPTTDVREFLSWMEKVRANGGLDEKENALEALRSAGQLQYRPQTNKVVLLITDAPFHQAGEQGVGTTTLTKESTIAMMNEAGLRVFCVVPERFSQYTDIAKATRGTVFNIRQDFSSVIDNFTGQVHPLYAIRYTSGTAMLPDSINVAILKNNVELVRKTIPILQVGRTIIIENLLFGFNQSTLRKSVPELDRIAEFMQRMQKVRVKIEGHTDGAGNDAVNLKLSQQRASAAKDYLIAKGISAKRIIAIGFGKRKPIGDNNTEFGRKLNRRTEVVIIEK